MAHVYTPQPSPWRTRLPLVIVLALAVLIFLAVGARALGIWPGAEASDPNAITVSYITEAGDNSTQGVVDSPLRIRVRIPWSTGSQDTIISGVALQILDDTNAIARFGNAQSEAFALKPTFDVAEWEWRGSVPSDPGKYHARIQVTALYNEERNGITELPNPAFEAVPEPGEPVRSGYVFASDSNLWLLTTDLSKQRRLTYFPQFYEYADKPQWSPDGSRIAFTYSPRADEDGLPATEIWTISPGGTPQPLVQSVGGESFLDATWSGDGKYLYYTVDTFVTTPTTDTTGTAASFGNDVHIERMEVATGAREQWMPSAQMPSGAGATGDTVFIEYVPPTDELQGFIAPLQRLVRAEADGETRGILVDETVFQLMYAPSVSPDGKWVAFAAVNIPPIGKEPFPTTIPYGTPAPNVTPSGGFDFFGWLGLAPRTAEAHGLPWDIFLVSSEGGKPIRLTTMDEDLPYPIWLDNTSIAFMGATGLYKLSIEGDGSPTGVPTRLHEGAIHGGLSWRGP
jgi:WD40-like Beta Propeller Repeat